MEIQYSPIVDADLEAAFLAESCRSVAALEAAEERGQGVPAWERSRQADEAAARLFQVRYPEGDRRGTLELLDEMIGYESYRTAELFPLFAKEARHDGAEEIALLFEREAQLAGERVRLLEQLRDGLCISLQDVSLHQAKIIVQ